MFKEGSSGIKLGAVSGVRAAASPWQCLGWRTKDLGERVTDLSTGRVLLRGFVKESPSTVPPSPGL